MSFFSVPARNDLPWYTFKITLSSVLYTLTFRYNTRMTRWIIDLSDATGNLIVAGIPLLILRDLLAQYSTLPLPPGSLFCIDDTNQETQPTRYSFGVDHTLIYGDPDS